MEDKRKLAHIEVIKSLSPIEGADLIEVAEVLGWQCVVKKGEFNVGDLVVYVEVDSVMPEKPEYEFLRNRKFRVKTIKLKGQISQGLVLPLGNLKGSVGDDVTDILEIKKYLTPSEIEEQEKYVDKLGKFKSFMFKFYWFRKRLSPKFDGEFPFWVSKTDEERIQNMPHILDQFRDKLVYVTEKIDYQSVTFTGKLIQNPLPIIGKFLPKKFQLIVCSRNRVNNDKNSLYWKIARKYNIEKILKNNPTLTIQGEQGNAKIQGNKYDIKEPTMWVFNIIDHEKNYHYDFEEIKSFCVKYDLKCVPELRFNIKLSMLGSTVQELVEFSKGKSTLANIQREGIVVRCIENGDKVFSFKVINPKFLLKYED